MAAKQGGGKKKRNPKVSKGIHGGGGRHRSLTEVELVLLGKGRYTIPAFGTRNQATGPFSKQEGVRA